MTLTVAELRQFSGSENIYYLPLFRNYNYTDGVRYLAQKAEAYWLIEAIFSWQYEKVIKNNYYLQNFQIWKLEVKEDSSAILSCYGDVEKPIASQNIAYTDFPLKEITLYLSNKILMLTTES